MNEEKESSGKKYPKGHFVSMWMGIGIAMFTGVGVPLGLATGTIGLIGIGPALGVAVGLAIGQGVENRYEKEGKIRPLTPQEIHMRKVGIASGIVLLVLGLAFFVLVFMLNNKV